MIRRVLLLTLAILLLALAIKGAEWFSGRIALPDGSSMHQAAQVEGWIDRAAVEDGRVVFSGWAVDTRAKAPVAKVAIYGNATKLGEFAPSVPRKDVAERLSAKDLGPAGFDAAVDASALGDAKGVEFRVFGLLADGRGEELRYATGLGVRTAAPGKNLQRDVTRFLAYVSDSMVPVFNVMRNPNAAVGLSLVMAAVGVFLLFWLLFVVMMPVWRDLARATARVRRLPDAAAFAENFADIDGLMSRIPAVAHGWHIFRSLLVLPPPRSGGAIVSGQRASALINLAEAEAAGLRLRFYQALPSYFVGFGLVFTFLGLVASIYFASQGVFASSLRETQLELGNLLAAATFKFLTSITGLGMSLVLSICLRIMLDRLQRSFDRLCAELERRMVIVAEMPREAAAAAVAAAAPAVAPGEIGAAVAGALAPVVEAVRALQQSAAAQAARAAPAEPAVRREDLDAVRAKLAELGAVVERLSAAGEGERPSRPADQLRRVGE